MSKGNEVLLADPDIKVGIKPTLVVFGLMTIFTAIAFIGKVSWMILVYKALLYSTCLLSVLVVITLTMTKCKIDTEKTTVPLRIPNWWMYISGTTTTILLWVIAPNPIVTCYFISKVVLSINYVIVMEAKDRAYTEKVEKRQKLSDILQPDSKIWNTNEDKE